MSDATVKLTAREKWLMLKAFWAGSLAQESSKNFNQPMISFDDWLNSNLTEKSTVETVLIQMAPPK